MFDIGVTLGIILGFFGISLFLFSYRLMKEVLIIRAEVMTTRQEMQDQISRIIVSVDRMGQHATNIHRAATQVKHQLIRGQR
jgi:hypothetical protein